MVDVFDFGTRNFIDLQIKVGGDTRANPHQRQNLFGITAFKCETLTAPAGLDVFHLVDELRLSVLLCQLHILLYPLLLHHSKLRPFELIVSVEATLCVSKQ